MKLNHLESKFFDDILKTELDVPVHATLKYGETTLDIIVVPEINSQGHFSLKYFNASPYEPKSDASGGITLSNRHLFGLHPLLDQAWRDRDSVTVQLKTAPHLPRPLYNAEQPQLNARIYQAGTHNRGCLVLDENQVVVKESLLKRAEFRIDQLGASTRRRGRAVYMVYFEESKWDYLACFACQGGVCGQWHSGVYFRERFPSDACDVAGWMVSDEAGYACEL